MKIAICNVQEFNPTIGGIERVSVSLAEGLIKEGVEVLFVACRKSPYSKPYTLPAKQVLLPNFGLLHRERTGVGTYSKRGKGGYIVESEFPFGTL